MDRGGFKPLLLPSSTERAIRPDPGGSRFDRRKWTRAHAAAVQSARAAAARDQRP